MSVFSEECRIYFSLSLFFFVVPDGVVGGGDTVTCGSTLKLVNTHYDVRLHSHDVKYGSGSGQQSVTGSTDQADVNSHWAIRGPAKKPCRRGDPVACGDVIRLTHLTTGMNLQSQHFNSPLSRHQEVSAHDGEDPAGHWVVMCEERHWKRDAEVTLRHVGSTVYLALSGNIYRQPVSGQYEVVGVASSDHNPVRWKAAEGMFIHPSEVPKKKLHTEHTEL